MKPIVQRPQSNKRGSETFRPQLAFTLIEIMVVVAIMGIILGMSIPFAKQITRREALTQATWDFRQVCENARKQAIFQGSVATVEFHAADGSINVGGPPVVTHQNPEDPDAPPPPPPVSTGGPAASGMTAHLGEQVVIHSLNINGVDCMEMTTARVRFFPNGTCDDMTLVLSRTDGRESTEMILEPTTANVWLESDRTKFRTKM